MAEPRFMQAPSVDDVPADNLGPRKQPRFMAAPSAEGEGATAGEVAVGGLGGFNRGLAQMAGLPVDLANLGLRQIPGIGPFVSSDQPFGGSQSIARGMQAITPGNVFPEPAPTGVGRFTARVGEELGRSALPAAGIMAQAARVPLAVGGATPTLAQTFFNPIRRAPGRAALGEAVAATGAGAGGAAAQAAFPGNQTAEMIGEIAGGLTPTALMTTPTAMMTRAATNAARRVSPAAQRAAGRRAAGELIGRELAPEAATGLSEAEALREDIPGFNPTLGEATNSPALLAQQRRLEEGASGQQLEQFAQRRAGAEQAVDQFAARQTPAGADVGAEDVIGGAFQRIQAAREGLSLEAGETAAERAAVADDLRLVDRREIGQAIRETFKEQRTAASERMTKLADDLGLSNADVSVNYGRLREEILADFEPGSVFENPRERPDVLADIERIGPDQNITFRDLKALRERVSDDIIDAMRQRGGRRGEIRQLVALKEQIDRGVSDLTFEADPQLAQSYDQFRRQYFDEFVTPFESGAASDIQARDSTGFFRTPDERVAEAFFAPGEQTAARQYRQIFNEDPSAIANLEAVALDSLRDAAVRDGVIEPRRAQTWLRRHQSVLDEFPEITGKIDNIFEADTALRDRAAQLNQRSKAIDEQFLTREIDAFSRGSRTPESVVQSALADPRKMRQLTQALGSERMPEFRRLLWRQASAGSTSDMLDFIARNRESLGAVFSPKHFEDLAKILTARSMIERSPTPRGSAAVSRPLENVERQIGQGIPQLGSRIFAFRSGRMQRGYLVLDSLLRGMRGRAAAGADELLSEALYDPTVARDMVTAIALDGRPRPAQANRLQARLFALPVTATQEQEQ